MTSLRVQLTPAAIEYLGQWASDCDQFDDYRVFYYRGYYEICAARLAGAGVLEDDDSRQAENIRRVASVITHKAEWKMVDECMDGVAVFECAKCNAVSFVDPDDLTDSIERFAEQGCYSCRQAPIEFKYIWKTGAKP